MSQPGFEVHLNGEQVCRAGLDEDEGTASCQLTSIKFPDRENTDFSISGLNRSIKRFVKWTGFVPLQPGDKLSIKVVSGEFDRPEIKPAYPAEKLLEDQIRQYTQLKKLLKDHI